MAASDVLVTKPGPGSLSEAFQKGLPVVVAENRETIPMERFNARFVAEMGVGVVVASWSEAPAAVTALAHDPVRRENMAKSIRALPENRAVYEALRIVEAAAQGRAAEQQASAASSSRASEPLAARPAPVRAR
jgi:1,2-diacylglycerol 3-beta-galactosyltransferase